VEFQIDTEKTNPT